MGILERKLEGGQPIKKNAGDREDMVMEGRGSHLHQAPSLLLKYINCILILHFQLQIDKRKKDYKQYEYFKHGDIQNWSYQWLYLSWCVSLINWLPIKPEPNLTHW